MSGHTALIPCPLLERYYESISVSVKRTHAHKVVDKQTDRQTDWRRGTIHAFVLKSFDSHIFEKQQHFCECLILWKLKGSNIISDRKMWTNRDSLVQCFTRLYSVSHTVWLNRGSVLFERISYPNYIICMCTSCLLLRERSINVSSNGIGE